MIGFIKDLATSLDDLYHYLIYLVENDGKSISTGEWGIRCNKMFNITQERCEINFIDRSQNIPSISVSNNNNNQLLQNNVTDADVLFGFVTVVFIWFIIAIIIILCTIIISLIITNIKSSYKDDEKDKNIRTITNYDLEKQSPDTIPETK